MTRYLFPGLCSSGQKRLIPISDNSLPSFRAKRDKKPDPSENQNQTLHTTIKLIKGTHRCLALRYHSKDFIFPNGRPPFFLCFLPLPLFQLQNNEKLKQSRIISPNSPTFFPFKTFTSRCFPFHLLF